MTDYLSRPRDLRPGSYVWAYLRDSGGPTQEQSVIQQEGEIRAYCKRHGLILTQLFKDIARSAGSVIGREAFNDLITASNDPNLRPAALLIWNFARFARDLDDSSYYKAVLRKRGVIVHSLTDPIPEGHMGRMVETLIDIANEEKRRQTSRDVKRGIASLVKQGFAPGGGKPPRGYKAVKVTIGTKRDGTPRIVSRWEPDPFMWDQVRLAWQMRAQGKSYSEIQEATARKIYKSDNCWPTFFRNKAYLGFGISGDLEVPEHHEPAITWEVWQAVQDIFKASPYYGMIGNPNHPRRKGNPSLLSGIAVCMDCGSAMIHHGGYKGHAWRSYGCGRKERQGNNACKARRVGAEKAENKILDAVISRVLSPSFLEVVIEEARASFSNTDDLDQKINLTKSRLAELERAIQNLLDTVEASGLQAAYDRLHKREEEHIQVKIELEHLEAERAAAEIEITPEAMAIALDTWHDRIYQAQETGDIRLLKAWLTRFVNQVELGYKRAKVYYTFPLEDLLAVNVPFARSLHGGTTQGPVRAGLYFLRSRYAGKIEELFTGIFNRTQRDDIPVFYRNFYQLSEQNL